MAFALCKILLIDSCQLYISKWHLIENNVFMSYTCASSPFFSSSTFTLIFRPCFTPAVFCLMFIQLWRIWKLPTGFRGGWPPRGRPRLCDITGCCSKKVGFRYFFEETEKKGDIYGPKCWIDLIFNLRVTLDFFFFEIVKFRTVQKV